MPSQYHVMTSCKKNPAIHRYEAYRKLFGDGKGSYQHAEEGQVNDPDNNPPPPTLNILVLYWGGGVVFVGRAVGLLFLKAYKQRTGNKICT